MDALTRLKAKQQAINEKHLFNVVFDEYDKDFRQAGFGNYQIDFSDVSVEMIVHLGEAIRDFYGRK